LYVKFFIGTAFIAFGVSLIFSTMALSQYRSYLEHYVAGTLEDQLVSTVEKTGVLYPLTFFPGGLLRVGLTVLLNLYFGS
jgi:hypothetical protein